MKWHEERLLIDGDLVGASGGATYETIDPATEEVLGVAADATVGDAQQAIAAARSRVARARPAPARSGAARERRRPARDHRARGRRTGLEHWRPATRSADRYRLVVRGPARGLRLRRGPRRTRHLRRPAQAVEREGSSGCRRCDHCVQLPGPTRPREARARAR